MSRALPALVLLLSACHWFGQSQSYTVVKGDTLTRIANAHGVTVGELKTWNGLTSDRIEIGQVLSIQTDAPEPAAPAVAAKAPRSTSTTRRSSAARKTSSGRTSSEATAEPPASGTPPQRLRLSMPSAKRCLEGPEVSGDHEIAASQGLSPTQIRRSVEAFLPRLYPCVDTPPSGALQLAFVVGCDGRVRSVKPDRNPGWDPRVAGCVTDAFRHASFPAHDLPDGETFTVPIRFD